MLHKLLTFSFFMLFLATPLIFTSFNSELFEYNKMMFVYSLTTIITGLWVMRAVSTKSFILKRTPLDIPLGLFLLSQIISTIFSIDPHTSLWGYYSRSNGGLLSTISYLLLYYAFVSNFSKDEVIKFLKVAVFGGVITALYAIPEHFGVSPSCVILSQEFTATCWVQDVQARVFGTLGQPNWLAAYLEMLIFPTIFLFLINQNLKARVLYLFSIVSIYLAFTFTYSRGATLGLIAGVLLIIVSQIVTLESKTLKLNLSSLKPLALVVGLLILINLFFGSALSDFRLLKNPAIPTRPGLTQTQAPPPSGTQLENGGTESGQIRLIVWKGALEIFKAYPLFGSGVETFAYSYYQFRPTEHNLVSEWDFLYNKAHNEYLNYLATTGAFGLFSYLLVILVFIYFALAKIFNFQFSNSKVDRDKNLLIISLFGGYVSYLIQNFFLFSVVITSVLFYLFPAFAFTYSEVNKDWSSKNWLIKTLNQFFSIIGKNKVSKWIAQILILGAILLTLNSLYSLWEADTYYKRGSDSNDLGNPGRAYTYLIQAVKLNTGEPLYLSELGNAAASSALALSTEDATTSAQLKDDSVFFTDLALSISPTNTTILRTAIRTFFQLALIDPAYEDKTLQIVDRSITLAPTDPKLLVNKSVIMTQLNKLNEATASLEKAIDLKPNYLEARQSLADLYTKQDQKEKAREQYEAILNLTPGDPEIIKLLEEMKK